MRFTATFMSPRAVDSVYTPTSSVSVKLTTPRVTCAFTERPLGVVTVAALTPCSTGSRIGWPAASCRLDWSSAGGMQPAQAVRQDQRERHAQREVGLEQVEADEDRLAVRSPRARRSAGRPTASTSGRPAASGRIRIASSMATLANSTCRMIGCARSQSMIVGRSMPAEHLDRHVGRHPVDEDEAAGPTLRRARRVDDDDVGLAHAALVLVGRLHLERHLRIRPEHLLEEEVAGAHQRDGDLPRRRQHGVRRVVGVEVVVDVDAGRDGAAAVVA